MHFILFWWVPAIFKKGPLFFSSQQERRRGGGIAGTRPPTPILMTTIEIALNLKWEAGTIIQNASSYQYRNIRNNRVY